MGASVMSGEVLVWWLLLGVLVGVLVLRIWWLDEFMMSSMSVPLWSVVVECQAGECALMSAVMMVLGMLVM